MAKNLQEQIRERAAERDAEGKHVNPSLEDLHHASRGTPLRKRRKKGRTSLIKSAANDASTAAGSVRAGDGSWFAEALAPNFGHAPEPLYKAVGGDPDSPAVAMPRDLNRLLTVFRDSEGRDPTEDDLEYWKSFAKIIRDGLGGE